MHRKHYKALKKMIKKDNPWDWEFFHNLVVIKLKQTYEYYVAGNLVHQSDEERKNLLKSMDKVMNILNSLEHVDDPFHNYLKDHPYPQPIFKDLGNGLCSIQHDELDEERMKIWTECKENYEKLFEKFYAKLGKEMRNWWD